MKEYSIRDYFELVKTFQVSSIEWQNFIEKITSNLDLQKLELLHKDVVNLRDTYWKTIKDEIHQEKLLLNGDKPRYSFQTKNPRNVKLAIIAPKEVYQKELHNLEKFHQLVEQNIKSQKNKIKEEMEEPLVDENPETIELDYEIENVLKTAEKLIYLNELGVLDQLFTKEPFDKSINKMASVLSPILGETKGNIQPVLNSIIKKNFDKNNPYSQTSEKVKKARNHLISLGFILTKE